MDQRTRILLIGALAGAATGLVAAMMLQRRAERTGTEVSLSTGEGIQLGMMVLGLVRAVAALADREDNK
jgi:phage protein U